MQNTSWNRGWNLHTVTFPKDARPFKRLSLLHTPITKAACSVESFSLKSTCPTTPKWSWLKSQDANFNAIEQELQWAYSLNRQRFSHDLNAPHRLAWWDAPKTREKLPEKHRMLVKAQKFAWFEWGARQKTVMMWWYCRTDAGFSQNARHDSNIHGTQSTAEDLAETWTTRDTDDLSFVQMMGHIERWLQLCNLNSNGTLKRRKLRKIVSVWRALETRIGL